jgi:hypothetical protein
MIDLTVRLPLGVALVPYSGGLLIEGGPRRHWLHGAAATEVLPGLLPMLDGRHDRASILAATDLDSDQLDQVLTMLGDNGLVDAADTVDDGPVARYFSRMLPSAPAHHSSGDIRAVLGRTVVHLIGDGMAALADDLTETGVGRIEIVARPEDAAAAEGGILVVAGDHLLDRALAAGRTHGCAVLRIAAGPDEVQVGPAYWPGFARACPGCLRRSLAEAGWAAGGAADPVGADLLGAMAAREIVALAAQFGVPTPDHSVVRLTLADVTTTRRVVVPYDGCTECGTTQRAPESAAHLAETYEWWMRARTKATPWVPTATFGRTIQTLQSGRPDYPTSPRVAPSDVLARLTSRVAGRKNPQNPADARRWAPSGGNFASAGAYVVDGRCLHYDDRADAFDQIHADLTSPAEALAGTDLAGTTPVAVVVLVASIGRLTGKYQHFAKRLAHLDAGVAALQLSLVAEGLDLDVDFATRWDEQLADLLELYPGGEVITVVAALHPGKDNHATG